MMRRLMIFMLDYYIAFCYYYAFHIYALCFIYYDIDFLSLLPCFLLHDYDVVSIFFIAEMPFSFSDAFIAAPCFMPAR